MSTLKVEEKITLAAPVERVWKFLLDPAAVASCLPGARLDAIEDAHNFTGTIKVKVGPVTTEFRGKATFAEVVPEEHRVRLLASGDDRGGSGSAKMVMASRIIASESGGSELHVTADVEMAGKLVRFGRGMMEGIGKQMFKQFAERVQKHLVEAEIAVVGKVAAAASPSASMSVSVSVSVSTAVAAVADGDGAPRAEGVGTSALVTAPTGVAVAQEALTVRAQSAPVQSEAMKAPGNDALDAGGLVWSALWAWVKGLLRRTVDGPQRPSGLTLRAIATGSLLAICLCAMNSYLTLSFGVIEEGPTIAALFFFAFFFLSNNKVTSPEMVIVSTMGSAGGSLGFISNFYAAKVMTGPAYSFGEMVAFGLVSSLVGMVMVIPLRQLLIVREQLPWPGAKATAGVITALVEEGDPRQPRYLLYTFVSMIILVLGNDEQGFAWWPTELALPGIAAYGAAIAYTSPFSLGGSYLMGMRTCVGFLFGAGALMTMSRLGWVADGDTATPHHFYWTGLGFLVASGLANIALNWRSISGAFRSLAAIGTVGQAGEQDDDPILAGRALLIVVVVVFVGAAVVLNVVFHLSLVLVVLLISIGGLLQNIIATRAAAQTAFNPARVMGILLQGVCAAFGGRAAVLNLTGAGFVAGSGAQAGVLTNDLAYGRWFKVPSRHQFWTQMLTIIPCTLVSAWVFQAINSPGELALTGGHHAAPVAKMWAASALMFEKGFAALPPNALTALLIGGLVGIFYSGIERVEKVGRWLPESIGVGLGLVLSVSTGITFFIGGFVMWIVLGRWLKVRDVTLTTIAVGSIVAEGIGGVLKPALIKLGLIHLGR